MSRHLMLRSQRAALTRRTLSSSVTAIPDSLTRVGKTEIFPHEYPGQNYAFNWCLNGDGVTPLRKSAFRMTKPLDLKIAGLDVLKERPLLITPADATHMPEAGSAALSFDTFDRISQRTRDLLSLADHLYCPEGHVPGTRTAVRVITNAGHVASSLVAYLDRAPRQEPPESLPVTVYVLEQPQPMVVSSHDKNTESFESFAGFAIEEVEVAVKDNDTEDPLWTTGEGQPPVMEAKSVASVVVVGTKIDVSIVVAGLVSSQKALAADELERQSKQQQQA